MPRKALEAVSSKERERFLSAIERFPWPSQVYLTLPSPNLHLWLFVAKGTAAARMAAQSEAITLECKWCGTQYEKGKESEKTASGDFKCRKNKRPGQEKYHPGQWVSKDCAPRHSSRIDLVVS